MFWDNFYSACLAKNIKPTALVQELGLARASVTPWKNGKIPNGEALIKIANRLGVSVDYLLGRNGTETEPTDPTAQLLLDTFNRLSPQDKLDVLNSVLEKNDNNSKKNSK